MCPSAAPVAVAPTVPAGPVPDGLASGPDRPAADGRRALRSTLAQVAGRLAWMAVSLAMVAFLTRRFGALGYGEFALISTYTTMATVLTDGGVPLLLARELSRRTDAGSLLGTALRGRLALTIPVYGLALGVAAVLYRHQPGVVAGIAVALLSLLPTTVSSTMTAVYQSRLHLSVLTTLDLAIRAVNLAAVVLTVTLGGGVLAVVALSVVMAALTTVVSLRLSGVPLADLRAWDRAEFVAMLRMSVPLGVAVVLNTLYARVDGLLLSVMRPVSDVGHYLLGYRVMEMALLFPGMLAATALPLYSRSAGERDLARLRRQAERSVQLVGLVMLPVAALFVVLGGPIVRLVAGPGFVPAGPVLQWLALATVASSINIVLGLVIIALDGQRRALWLNVSGLVVNLALNLALIPHFGINAAAAVTSVSECLVAVGCLWIVRGHLSARLRLGALARLLPSVTVCGLVGWLLRTAPLPVSLGAAVSAYGVAAVATRQLGIADLRLLRSLAGHGRGEL